MAETRGVFSLSRVFARAKKGTWVTPDESFTQLPPAPTPNTGYFGGGSPGPLSTMDKVTYSSDTTAAVPSAVLNVARYSLAATGSSTAGYFGGGYLKTTMEKVTYSTDTTAEVPAAALSSTRYMLGATGTSTAGYFGGGSNPPNITSTMDKLTYSSDTTAYTPSANLSVSRHSLSATGNTTAGYFGGGVSSSGFAVSTMDKTTYSSDTTAAVPGAFLTFATWGKGATGNSTAGYFGGGRFPSFVVTMDKVTYSSDTTAAVSGAALSAARAYLTATGSSTAGYFGGGLESPGNVSKMDKTTYSSDTTALVPGAALSGARQSLAASSARANALPTETAFPIINLKGTSEAPNTGYWTGGEPGPGPYLSSTNKINLTSETTTAVPSANLPDSTYGNAASSSPAALYSYGGQMPAGAKTTVSKLTYSTETYAYATGTISQGRLGLAATGKSDAGYFAGGGAAPTYYSLMSKFSYATDTSQNLPAGNLSQARATFAAAGSPLAGYWAGGEYPAPNTHTSQTDKCTYSVDTTALTPSAALSQSKFGLLATGGPTAAYFTQGYSPSISSVSTTDKLIYSTDTRLTVPGAYSTYSANDGKGGIGNPSSGYWGGGAPTITTVNRVTYSTDTTIAVPGANLVTGRNRMGAAGARSEGMTVFKPAATPTPSSSIPGSVPNTGYYGGHNPFASTVTKINFTTDTVTTPTNLTQTRSFGGGNSSATAAYFGGGAQPSPINESTMDKLTYSTDTLSAVSGAVLTQARYLFGGQVAGDSTKALWAGGYTTPATPRSTADRLTFSSDTTAAVPGAALSAAKYGITANASPSAGYVAGGSTGGGSRRTDIDKISLSTETTSRMPSGDLPSTRSYAAGMSYPNAGYFLGGFTPSLISEMMKLNFASDTLSRTSNYPATIAGATATGNSEAAYFSGGQTPSYVTSTEKLQYSTDTFTRSAANIPTASGYATGASARSQGGRYTSNIL